MPGPSVFPSGEPGVSGIVLMHDLYQSTADATKEIVPALIDAGFQLVTVEEMGILKTNGAGLENGTVYYSIPNK